MITPRRQSRHFEVARAYRFAKGSGIPVRIPVIDMVEIGAGGGSIARVDPLRRIAVGPDSAGSNPGPGLLRARRHSPTVTDADVVLGRIDPTRFRWRQDQFGCLAGGTRSCGRHRRAAGMPVAGSRSRKCGNR